MSNTGISNYNEKYTSKFTPPTFFYHNLGIKLTQSSFLILRIILKSCYNYNKILHRKLLADIKAPALKNNKNNKKKLIKQIKKNRQTYKSDILTSRNNIIISTTDGEVWE